MHFLSKLRKLPKKSVKLHDDVILHHYLFSKPNCQKNLSNCMMFLFDGKFFIFVLQELRKTHMSFFRHACVKVHATIGLADFLQSFIKNSKMMRPDC